MQRLEVSGAVRPIYGSLGVKRLMHLVGFIIRIKILVSSNFFVSVKTTTTGVNF